MDTFVKNYHAFNKFSQKTIGEGTSVLEGVNLLSQAFSYKNSELDPLSKDPLSRWGDLFFCACINRYLREQVGLFFTKNSFKYLFLNYYDDFLEDSFLIEVLPSGRSFDYSSLVEYGFSRVVTLKKEQDRNFFKDSILFESFISGNENELIQVSKQLYLACYSSEITNLLIKLLNYENR